MKDPSQVRPIDDSGSDTFGRYVYQAEVAFKFCLACAVGSEIIAVIAEHLEDIALHCSNGWRFLQVKTRNAERGSWKLSDVSGKDGGLHSLLRTFYLLHLSPPNYTLELHLEGALAPRDDINLLLTEEGRENKLLIDKLCKALKLDSTSCKDFLNKLRVSHSLPSRTTITACNIRLLLNESGNLLSAEVEDLYDKVIRIIETAMAAALLRNDWRKIICNSESFAPNEQYLFEQKRISRDMLAFLANTLTGAPQPLLKLLTQPDGKAISALEQKLLIGGATPQLIIAAKSLRAQAVQWEIENESSYLYRQDDLIEDVRTRLHTRVVGLVAQHGAGPTPAAVIWNELIRILRARPRNSHLTLDK